MESSPIFASLCRRFGGLAVVGGGLVFFAGPILVVVMTVAAFAGIGFLLWLPLHSAVVGQRGLAERWLSRVRSFASAVQQWLPAVRDTLLEVACGSTLGLLVAFVAGIAEPGIATAALVGAAAGAAVAWRR